MKPTICGDNAIYVPSQEPCTDCERFEHRLDEAEEDIVAVGQEVNALNTYLNNRIDNIITSPAPSEQEIIDARMGADGIVYTTLGAAIRTQDTNINNMLKLAAYDLTNPNSSMSGLYSFDDVGWEQGGFNSSGDTESTKYIRTGLLLGGFLLHDDGNRYVVGAFNDTTGTVSYPWMTTDSTKEWYWIPKNENQHVKIRQRRTNSGDLTPAGNKIKIYRPIGLENENEVVRVLGHYINYVNGAISGDSSAFRYVELKVSEGMMVNYCSIINVPDSRGLAFYDNDENFISGTQMIATPQKIPVPANATILRATVRYSAEEIILSAYNVALSKLSKDLYGYSRNYTDITYGLNWQHKTFDGNGNIIDSDYNIMAEIPNVGNVEVKMNRPYVKFRIYVSTRNDSSQATMLQDWSHYFYRYTPDATGHLHYYVVVALESGEETTSNAFTVGRRGIKVYTYEDSGVSVKCPESIYGKNVAVFGDSIVQGRTRKNEADSTNTVLSKPWSHIVAECCGTEPANYGIGGAQVYGTDWLSLFTNRSAVQDYDVVFVCAGTNDFGEEVTEANFKSAYRSVLAELKANNTRVIAVTPCSRRSNSANDIGLYLADYAEFVKTVAEEQSVEVIDLYALTAKNTVFKNNLPDGLHPNDIGQKIIADAVLSQVV